MKHIVLLLILPCFLVISCNNKKNAVNNSKTDSTGSNVVNVETDNKKTGTEVGQQQKDELEKMTPLTKDELTALVPSELMASPRSGLDVSTSMGTLVASADYKVNDTAAIKLEIVDCAGPGGAGMFGTQYLNMLNVNSDDEDEYIKTIDLNGGKAFENCKKNRNRCSVAWFDGKRFLISLTGDNIGIDALKDLAGKVKIR